MPLDPVEKDTGSGFLTSDKTPSPADPDLVVLHNAAGEYDDPSAPKKTPAAGDASDIQIVHSGFNMPEIVTGPNQFRSAHPTIPPPPKPVIPQPPPPELDFDAILAAAEAEEEKKRAAQAAAAPKPPAHQVEDAAWKKNTTALDWDDAFVSPFVEKPKHPVQEAPLEESRKPQRARRRNAITRVLFPMLPELRRSRDMALAGLGVFGVSTFFMLQGLEPFYSWFYILAWYPFLLAVNWAAATRNAKLSIFAGRQRDFAALFAWSAPVWMFFELWNFRLQNWYYIGVPDVLPLRWTGILIAFATVLPGIFLLEELFASREVFKKAQRAPLRITNGLLLRMKLTGIGLAAAILALPDFFFAFLWAVPTLLIEPWLYRRGSHSLLHDLEEGRPGRMLRLMLAGLGCGLFWETANFLPGGKWVYTVPWVGSIKIFEMPVLGFIGFAPFGLACWSIARALVEAGLLPEWTKKTDGAPRRVVPPQLKQAIYGATALACLFTLLAMDIWTVDSTTPRPENVPAIPDGIAEYAHKHGHHDVRGLLQMIDAGAFNMPGESSAQILAGLAERCRLVLLKGIGTENAQRLYLAGVRSRADLAASDKNELVQALAARSEKGWQPSPRRVEVWIRAAQRDLAGI
ncbi:MAG TPA: DUF4332 domain-containing protein [bacterium]|nr:DUF4332 domain-containing protein [bacterium]